MTAKYTNLITVPGMNARVVVDADYNWRDLGGILAEGFDAEQAELLDDLSRGLRTDVANGLMQLQYVSDAIRDHPDEYDIDAIRWFLSELLIRLDDDR